MATYFPQAHLSECFLYDGDTGLLRWRERPRSHFKNDGAWKAFNTRWAGKPALNGHDGRGYRNGTLDQERGTKAHRVAWALVHGEWPECIDHINGVVDDNRLLNLRAANSSINAKNKGMISTNTSGQMGVGWSRRDRKWVARIKTGGKERSLGYYTDKDEAIRARLAAEVASGFHPNHGQRPRSALRG